MSPLLIYFFTSKFLHALALFLMYSFDSDYIKSSKRHVALLSSICVIIIIIIIIIIITLFKCQVYIALYVLIGDTINRQT